MDLSLGDILVLKKGHPCGTNEWEVIRVGMDIRLRCMGCDRQVLLPRKQVEKSIKNISRKKLENNKIL